jgi:hypothetical protein
MSFYFTDNNMFNKLRDKWEARYRTNSLGHPALEKVFFWSSVTTAFVKNVFFDEECWPGIKPTTLLGGFETNSQSSCSNIVMNLSNVERLKLVLTLTGSEQNQV